MKFLAVILFGAIMMAGMAGGGYAQDAEQSALDQINMWQRAAAQGDAEAEVNLGNTYREGWGIKKDDQESVKWYRKAADQGVADAQYKLGLAYFTGRGIEQDYKEALKWYAKAADRGNPEAIISMGDAYAQGIGVEKDIKQAINWYQKAAQQGYPDAQAKIGEAYHTGVGLPKDEKEAIYWFQKAAEHGSLFARARLAQIEDEQGGLFRMKNIPIAVGLSVVLASVLSLITFIMQMRRDGAKQFELNFFQSPQFGLLMSGALIFYTLCLSSGADGIGIAQGKSLVPAAIALLINISRSNMSFGVLYTLAQAVTAYTIFLVFCYRDFQEALTKKLTK